MDVPNADLMFSITVHQQATWASDEESLLASG
jgi:hypothetical protein